MKKFRELHIDGLKEHVDEFVNLATSTCTNGWKCTKENIIGFEYVVFEYWGNRYPKAKVFLAEKTGDVSNIVPIEKGQLTIDEYNGLLEDLYNRVLKDSKIELKGLTIGELGSEECDLREIFGVNAYSKLEVFCMFANKGSGSADPNDRKLWFDFIRCAFLEKKDIDIYYLERALTEEFGWSNRLADELVNEYILVTDFMKYLDI